VRVCGVRCRIVSFHIISTSPFPRLRDFVRRRRLLTLRDASGAVKGEYVPHPSILPPPRVLFASRLTSFLHALARSPHRVDRKKDERKTPVSAITGGGATTPASADGTVAVPPSVPGRRTAISAADAAAQVQAAQQKSELEKKQKDREQVCTLHSSAVLTARRDAAQSLALLILTFSTFTLSAGL
jgi:hypothetical protein